MADDQFLQNYVKKLMEREMNLDDPAPLSDEQLKQVALDMGMSEKEWLQVLKDAQAAQNRGTEHLSRGNYKDAIKEFKESISLYPNSTDSFYGLACSLFKKAVEEDNTEALDQATTFVNRTLKLEHDHTEALDLKSHIRQYQSIQEDKVITKSNFNKYKKYIVFGVPLLILILWLIISYNSVNSLNTEIETKWAQVENVHQRRADLIPQLVKVVKKAASHEKDLISSALKARSSASSIHIDPSNLTEEQMQSFINSQSKISHSIGKLFAVAEQYPQSKAIGNFSSLQDQIEGSENRITVANKYYNEAVGKYNKKIRAFPLVLLPYQTKPYIKVPSSKMDVPDIDL